MRAGHAVLVWRCSSRIEHEQTPVGGAIPTVLIMIRFVFVQRAGGVTRSRRSRGGMANLGRSGDRGELLPAAGQCAFPSGPDAWFALR